MVKRKCRCKAQVSPSFRLPGSSYYWCVNCPSRPPEAIPKGRCECGAQAATLGLPGQGRQWCAICPMKPSYATSQCQKSRKPQAIVGLNSVSGAVYVEASTWTAGELELPGEPGAGGVAGGVPPGRPHQRLDPLVTSDQCTSTEDLVPDKGDDEVPLSVLAARVRAADGRLSGEGDDLIVADLAMWSAAGAAASASAMAAAGAAAASPLPRPLPSPPRSDRSDQSERSAQPPPAALPAAPAAPPSAVPPRPRMLPVEDEVAATAYMGKRVQRVFQPPATGEAPRVYRGKVRGVRFIPLFDVEYEDGDIEELDAAELVGSLLPEGGGVH